MPIHEPLIGNSCLAGQLAGWLAGWPFGFDLGSEKGATQARQQALNELWIACHDESCLLVFPKHIAVNTLPSTHCRPHIAVHTCRPHIAVHSPHIAIAVHTLQSTHVPSTHCRPQSTHCHCRPHIAVHTRAVHTLPSTVHTLPSTHHVSLRMYSIQCCRVSVLALSEIKFHLFEESL